MEYKGYRITRNNIYSTYFIQATGKGQVPKVLRGEFTNPLIAQKAINTYISIKGSKANGKESSSSTN